MSNERVDVLFVCVHNAGRSVAAKLLFNDRAEKLGLGLSAESAGTVPGEHINPAVKRVLESFKLNTSREAPKLMADEMLTGNPRVVTMGCQVDAEACPAIKFDDVDDWGLPDPSEMTDDEEIVSLIHEIARRVNTLIRELSVQASPKPSFRS